MARMKRSTRWSQVPPEILDLVLQSLPHPDCLNFGKVCSSWRSVFLDRRRISRPPPSILQIPLDGRIPLQLWGLHGDRLVRVLSPTPKLPLNLSLDLIVGSLADWLVIVSRVGVDPYSQIYLLNPISGRQIPLPSVASGGMAMHRFPCKEICFLVGRVVMSSPPTTTGDCILVAQVSYRLDEYCPAKIRLTWCRPGDSNWTILTFQPEYLSKISDSVFHKGELYVLWSNGDYLVCTFNPEPQITIRSTFTSAYDDNSVVFNRLVVSGGEVLLVLHVFGAKLHVFREQGRKWVRVTTLGDRVLLIGWRGAVSLCTKDLMGSTFEPNCIYYESSCRLLGKYCMTDQSLQEIPVPRSSENYLAPELQWIVPQGW